MASQTNHVNIHIPKYDIGAHTSFSNCIYNSIRDAVDKGLYAMQIFFGNPKSFHRHRMEKNDIDKSKKLLDRYPMHIISHFPYIANLAGSKNIAAWDGNEEQDRKTSLLVKSLEYELEIMASFNSKSNGVVIHPGNHKDRDKGLKKIAETINRIKFVNNSMLLLENSSGGGTSLATTFEEIKTIIDQVDITTQKHIGVCIDTAHIFGFGLYDLRKCSEVIKMFNDFDRIIGKERFRLLHLNDSMVGDGKKDAFFGSKKDRHENLGYGHIWKDNLKPLKLLLDKCKEWNVPIILETPCPDIDIYVLFKL